MTTDAWVIATDARRLAAMTASARGAGGCVTVAAVGPRSLAEQAAAAGPDAVAWIETDGSTPAEAYAPALAAVVGRATPRALLAAPTPAGRALLGAVAAKVGAVVLSGVLGLSVEGETTVVELAGLGGRVLETLATDAPLAALFGGGDDTQAAGEVPTVPIEALHAEPADLCLERTAPVPGATGGVATATRVVSVGRGLKARADVAMVDGLATALDAEIGCSMPIAEDFGWVAKERYIGRSGQHIAPRLYLALGISGTPQHLEGVRDAKTVVAVNSDPGAHIFRRADYGIVGDLYEVVPAIRQALGK